MTFTLINYIHSITLLDVCRPQVAILSKISNLVTFNHEKNSVSKIDLAVK